VQDFQPRLGNFTNLGIIEYLQSMVTYLVIQYFVLWIFLEASTSHLDYLKVKSVTKLCAEKNQYVVIRLIMVICTMVLLIITRYFTAYLQKLDKSGLK